MLALHILHLLSLRKL